MNLDDPKLTAFALDELDEPERSTIANAIAESPEAQRYVAGVRELAEELQSEFVSELKKADALASNLIDIRDDPWFWSIGRPLAIAATIAVAALIAALAIGTYKRNNAPTLALLHSPAELPEVAAEFEMQPPPGSTPNDLLSNKPIELGAKKLESSQLIDPNEQGWVIAGTGDDKTNIVVYAEWYNRAGISSGDTKAHNEGKSKSSGVAAAGPSSFAVGGEHRRAATGNVAGRVGESFRFNAITPHAAPVVAKTEVSATQYHGAINSIRESTGDFNTAAYDHILENPFLDAKSNPLSTFSIDVDTASYSNIRRFVNEGSLPPKDAVRVEEMVNYFTYDYAQPNDDKPFAVHVDLASCPWEPSHRLVRIGLKGKEIAADKRGASNLVFLLDVSGSMQPAERLPLIKKSMRLLVEKLTENDRVAIVVYAGNSGLVLPSTDGAHKEQIFQALENLEAGGSTNGAEGIELAYKIAADNFTKGGVNRVILATDGDFNIGVTNQGDLIRLIEEKAKSGVFLSVLGVGHDNLKDSTMQKLADKGNGNYAYLDSLDEARKVLVQQMNGTLVTIAKDVKIQVGFNPARVASYRLIGYEKRMLRKEDFNNDKIDAGEIGAGHTVTALYEVVPVGAAANPAAGVPPVDPLKYSGATEKTAGASLAEMLTVKLRYKKPDGDKSELIERAVTDSNAAFASASPDFKFAAAVAEFGMLLRDSEYKGNGTIGAVLEWAQEGKASDPNGYRAGFIELVRKTQLLKKG